MPPCKGHKKSRRGCKQCKSRHVKCDEQRPACLRCVGAKRQCAYAFEPVTGQAPVQSQWPTFDEHWQGDTPPSTGSSSTWAEALRLTPASSFHLELFHNFVDSTCRTIARRDAEVEVYRRAMLSRVFNVPYLLQAMLALSALHLSLQPGATSNHRHAATALQSQALESFDSAKVLDKVDKDNVLDLLLFQHLTAIHVFCDTFTSSHADFGEFLEELVRCVQLLGAVNSVISEWWTVLAQTELGEVMTSSDAHQNSSRTTGAECQPLFSMLAQADLSELSIQICREAVERLQSFFDAEKELDEQALQSTNMVFAWLIVAKPEFTSLLLQRRPEALIILAYYAVILHNRRKCWAVAHAGRNILQHITRYVGSSWDCFLSWPHSVVDGEVAGE